MSETQSNITKPDNTEGESSEKPVYTMHERLAYWKLSVVLFFGFLIIDHASKFWAIWALKPKFDIYGVTMEQYSFAWQNGMIPVIPIVPGCLQLIYAENRGAAFSMFDGSTFFLGLVSLVATVGLSWFWYTMPPTEKLGRISVSLILSGAVGNMIDRFLRGYVVDFIDAYLGQYHWPTFNIADSCICVGAVLLGIRFWQGKI